MAVCRICNIEKNQDLMVKHRTDEICKLCNSEYRKSKHHYKTRPWSTTENYKVCRLCNEEKHIDKNRFRELTIAEKRELKLNDILE